MPHSRLRHVRTIGRYEVISVIGAGGMAEVFKGRLRGAGGFEREVVLKQLLPSLAQQGGEYVSMFRDEARVVARIRHANVVQVFELIDQLPPALVMEYLDGVTVNQLLSHLAALKEPMPPGLAAWLVAEACAGVHAAHELADDQGHSLELVHRDLSPQNLFVTWPGEVKVLDFGVARVRDAVVKTEAGQLRGKFAYMSPEQMHDEPLDRRSDLFSLGIVLWELLTGKKLFHRSSPMASARAISEEPILAPSRVASDVSPQLEAVVMRALARDRTERFQTALELRRALLAAMPPLQPSPAEALAALLEKHRPQLQAERERLHTAANARLEPDTRPAVTRPRLRPLPVFAVALAAVIAAAVLTRNAWRAPPAPVDDERSEVTTELGAERAAPTTPTVLAPVVSPPPEVDVPSGGASANAVKSAETAPPSPAASADIVTWQLTSEPAGATVFLDGTQQGRTPVTLRLPAVQRERALEFRRSSFHIAREKLPGMRDAVVRVRLKPVKGRVDHLNPPDELREKW